MNIIVDVVLASSVSSILTEIIQLFGWFQKSDTRKRALAAVASIVAALYIAQQNSYLHFVDWKTLIALVIAIVVGSYAFYKAIIKLVLPNS